MKAQAPARLQRRILAPNTIDARDEAGKAMRSVEIPPAELILLRVEVLLTARLSRPVLDELECRPVDAVARRERRGEHEPAHEGRTPAVLEVLVDNFRRV